MSVAVAPAYRPAWYPNQDPDHNPWATVETVAGLTHYDVWVKSLKPGELLGLIKAHRERVTA